MPLFTKAFFAAVALIAIALVGWTSFPSLGGSVTGSSVTDLEVGKTYQVADFESCSLPNGSKAYEWHFGGDDRSRRNQLTPHLDGRGRRILRQSTDIPAGSMRLSRVVEHREDPMLEGFRYGTFREDWEGLVIDYNGRVESQRVVRPCGPARS